jgi:hypothetical protein
MRHLFSVSLWVAILTCLFLPSPSSADDWNRETTAIFNQPVRIPGQVLPAGIYVFKLADISGERSVVQIWNADRTVLHATVFGWPDYLRKAPTENRFLFEEREKGAPGTAQSLVLSR